MVLLTMVLSVSLYSYGKSRTRQAAFVRRRNGTRTSTVLETGNNNTVIYTIPTTHQLARQYPSISQSTTTNINMPNHHNDLPPSYDQVVIISRDDQQNPSSPTR
ncbi:unnamed protein product [Diamesa serratosioi]